MSTSSMTVEESRFETRTRLQAASSGHVHDIGQRPERGLFGSHKRIRMMNRISSLLQAIQTQLAGKGHGNNYLPCIWTVGATTRKQHRKLYICFTIRYNSKGWVWPKPVSLGQIHGLPPAAVFKVQDQFSDSLLFKGISHQC